MCGCCWLSRAAPATCDAGCDCASAGGSGHWAKARSAYSRHDDRLALVPAGARQAEAGFPASVTWDWPTGAPVRRAHWGRKIGSGRVQVAMALIAKVED